MTCSKCGFVETADINAPPSPVPHLFQTQGAPSQTEATLIRRTLSGLHMDISKVDSEMRRLRGVLDRLSHTRSSLQRSLEAHKSLFAPIRRIPPELLAEIFQLSRLPEPTVPMTTFTQAVLLPLQVCTQWRNVAILTPSLWASFDIVLKKNWKTGLALARCWLSRSGELPLSLRLWVRLYSRDYFEEFLNVIMPYRERWKHLLISLPLQMPHHLSLPKGTLPMLESLHLSGPGTEYMQGVSLFKSAPRLQKLRLDHSIWPNILDVPWDQLSECCIIGLGLKHVFEALSRSPNLTRLKIDFDLQLLDYVSFLMPVEHYRLESLEILENYDIGPFFDRITLPALRELTFRDCFWKEQTQLLSFLSRSACPIQKLSLSVRGTTIDDYDLLALLQLMPSLNELTLDHDPSQRCITTNFLERMTSQLGPDHNGRICALAPNLERIEIRHTGGFDARAFISMIESRWSSSHSNGKDRHISSNSDTATLRVVKIHGLRDHSCESVLSSELGRLAAEGLDLYIATDKLLWYDRSGR